jgi:hypothetical protein
MQMNENFPDVVPVQPIVGASVVTADQPSQSITDKCSQIPEGNMSQIHLIGGAGAGDQSSLGGHTLFEVFPHWQRFLSLESEFNATIEFVDLRSENHRTFSNAFVRILLTVSSEVDVLLKVLCSQVRPTASARNINDYRDIVTAEFLNFCSMRVAIPRYGLSLQPWIGWNLGPSPTWWQAYNKVKHERNAHYSLANQEMAINALAGLFCVILYCHQQALYANRLFPKPILLNGQGPAGSVELDQYRLPDFP